MDFILVFRSQYEYNYIEEGISMQVNVQWFCINEHFLSTENQIIWWDINSKFDPIFLLLLWYFAPMFLNISSHCWRVWCYSDVCFLEIYISAVVSIYSLWKGLEHSILFLWCVTFYSNLSKCKFKKWHCL